METVLNNWNLIMDGKICSENTIKIYNICKEVPYPSVKWEVSYKTGLKQDSGYLVVGRLAV